MSVEFSHEGHLIKVSIQRGVQIRGLTAARFLLRLFDHLLPRNDRLTYWYY